jgi:hypothetical protein
MLVKDLFLSEGIKYLPGQLIVVSSDLGLTQKQRRLSGKKTRHHFSEQNALIAAVSDGKPIDAQVADQLHVFVCSDPSAADAVISKESTQYRSGVGIMAKAQGSIVHVQLWQD